MTITALKGRTKTPVCPNCGAPGKPQPKMLGPWQDRVAPTTYTCGTVTSPNWAPPLIYCNQGDSK